MDNDVLTREPPHSDDAELAVLGAVLVRGDALRDLDGVVEPEDFYRTAHRLVFAAMRGLRDAKSPIDPVTLAEALRASGDLENVGGLVFIDRLLDVTATSANVAHYGGIVAEKAFLRQQIVIAHDLMGRAYNGDESASDVAQHAAGALGALMESRARPESVSIGDLAQDTLARARLARDGKPRLGDTCGLGALDDLLGGFVPGRLYTIAGRPGMGKTALGLQLALDIARRHRKRVEFFSVEMTRQDLGDRAVAGTAGYSARGVVEVGLPPSRFADFERHAATFEGVPLHVDDRARCIEDIRARAAAAKYQHGCAGIVVDYIQIVQSRRRFQTERDRNSHIAYELRDLGKALGIWVVALSQLNRDCEKRNPPRPAMSDLKESGAIEEASNAVLLAYWPGYYNRSHDPIDEYFVNTTKNRHGATGEVRIRWTPAATRFEDWVDHDVEPPAQRGIW